MTNNPQLMVIFYFQNNYKLRKSALLTKISYIYPSKSQYALIIEINVVKMMYTLKSALIFIWKKKQLKEIIMKHARVKANETVKNLPSVTNAPPEKKPWYQYVEGLMSGVLKMLKQQHMITFADSWIYS